MPRCYFKGTRRGGYTWVTLTFDKPYTSLTICGQIKRDLNSMQCFFLGYLVASRLANYQPSMTLTKCSLSERPIRKED